jgi:hypothetical protein
VDQLIRATFSTSRLAEFASEKGLTTQTGHGPDQWPQVIVKELTDNGIDATEAIGVPPIINITVADNAITVTDNGGGISPKDLARILDYTQRVSSNEAYVGPTRGRQGNALQTVLAIPFVMDDDSRDKRGETTIESRGILQPWSSKLMRSVRSRRFRRRNSGVDLYIPVLGSRCGFRFLLAQNSTRPSPKLHKSPRITRR